MTKTGSSIVRLCAPCLLTKTPAFKSYVTNKYSNRILFILDRALTMTASRAEVPKTTETEMDIYRAFVLVFLNE